MVYSIFFLNKTSLENAKEDIENMGEKYIKNKHKESKMPEFSEHVNTTHYYK